MSKKINLNQERLEMFYEQFGSKSFQLQSEMGEDFGKRSLTLFYKSVDFVYNIVTTVGIVAGFGFTALGFVKNIFLFAIGEVLLFGAISFGIWAIQKIYLSEKSNFDKFYSKIRLHFSERNALFESIFNKALSNNLMSDDFKYLQDKDKELISILTDSPEVEKDRKDILAPIIWTIFILFVVGSLLLISSFLFCKL